MNRTIKEFLKYIIVGGISFIVDFGTMTVFMEKILPESYISLYTSVAAGFIIGVITNYLLSYAFVFKGYDQKQTAKSFIIFVLIGLGGLLITELLMHLGVKVMDVNYMLTRIVVAGIVLAYNFAMRKILIFR